MLENLPPPELAKENPSAQDRMNKGNVVGDLATSLFGDYEEVTVTDETGKIDLGKMIKIQPTTLIEGWKIFAKRPFPTTA